MTLANPTNLDYYERVFGDKKSSDTLEKIAALHKDQLENYLKERCILNQVLPPESITVADCEIGETHDTFYKRIWFQQETRAYQSTFEGTAPEVQEVYVPRGRLGFLMLSTVQYVVNDYNLQVYPFNVVEQIEEQIGMDMQEAREWTMADALEKGIQLSRGTLDNVIRGSEADLDITVNGVGSNFRGKITRDDLIAIKQYHAGSRSRTNCIVIPETDYIDFERFNHSDYGDNLMEKVFNDGLQADNLHGLKILRTIKVDNRQGDTFRKGNVYAFARAEEMGKNYNLRGIRFFVNRDHQHLYFDAQESFGFIWQVFSRIAKLELYNGGTETDNTTPVPNYDVNTPGSDAMWASPEQIMQKDYYNLEDEFQVPLIHVTGS